MKKIVSACLFLSVFLCWACVDEQRNIATLPRDSSNLTDSQRNGADESKDEDVNEPVMVGGAYLTCAVPSGRAPLYGKNVPKVEMDIYCALKSGSTGMIYNLPATDDTQLYARSKGTLVNIPKASLALASGWNWHVTPDVVNMAQDNTIIAKSRLVKQTVTEYPAKVNGFHNWFDEFSNPIIEFFKSLGQSSGTANTGVNYADIIAGLVDAQAKNDAALEAQRAAAAAAQQTTPPDQGSTQSIVWPTDPMPTSTPTPEATPKPTPEATSTPTPEATSTPTPEATPTPTPEAKPTPEATPTPTPEATPTPTPVVTP